MSISQIMPASPVAANLVHSRRIMQVPDLSLLQIGQCYLLGGELVKDPDTRQVYHQICWDASVGPLRYRAIWHGDNVGLELVRLPDWLVFSAMDASGTYPGAMGAASTPPPEAPGAAAFEQGGNLAINEPFISDGAVAGVVIAAEQFAVNPNAVDNMHQQAQADMQANSAPGDDAEQVEYTKAQHTAVLKAVREYYEKDFAVIAKAKSPSSPEMHKSHVMPLSYVVAKVGKLATFKKVDGHYMDTLVATIMADLCAENLCTVIEGEARDYYNMNEPIYGLYASVIE